MDALRVRASRLVGLPTVLVLILVAPASAGGQSAVDQYVPELDRGGASPDQPSVPGSDPATPEPDQSRPGESKRPGTTAGNAATTEADGGEVEISGVPLTPFAAILLGLVLLAIIARLLTPRLSRLAASVRAR